jgi:hypothetical protein
VSGLKLLWIVAAALGVNASLGGWLPNPDSGFTAWSAGEASVTNRHDYFVCGTSAPTEKPQSFDYAGSACPALKNGTSFSYGSGEPIAGRAVYDRARRIALYFKGCCAWRGFALTANVAAPPSTVAGANLSAVRTHSGIALGMTKAQVERIYGAARSHATKSMPGVTTLTYTTMKSKNSAEACGQWQSFSFRNDALVSIELLAGC